MCKSSKEILEVQENYLKEAQDEKKNRREQCDFPSSEDSSDDDDNVNDSIDIKTNEK